MLMQLVCVDRRYQRMNCFNIRELQGILKRKFFTDLVNTNDHRDFLNQSVIGLRFKSNNNLAITPEIESFFNLGTTLNTKSKSTSLQSMYLKNPSSIENYFSFNIMNAFTYTSSTLHSYLSNLFLLLTSVNIYSLLTLFSLPKNFLTCLVTNLNFGDLTQVFTKTKSLNSYVGENNKSVNFSADNNSITNTEEWSSSLLSETSNNLRFTKFQNPLISYDYKCGHYLGI